MNQPLPPVPKIPFAKRKRAIEELKARNAKKRKGVSIALLLMLTACSDAPLTGKEADVAAEWCAPHGGVHHVIVGQATNPYVEAVCNDYVTIRFPRIKE